MGDVFCKRCGEPWDWYGAKHGDMTPEEYNKFMHGLGCPSCFGKPEAKEEAREIHGSDKLIGQYLSSLFSATDEDPTKWL